MSGGWNARPHRDGSTKYLAVDEVPGGAAYADLVEALRHVQDVLHETDLPQAEAQRATQLLCQAATLAAPFVVPEGRQAASRRPDLPGRGNTMLPAFLMRGDVGPTETGTGRFSRSYLGRGAVHGGVVALLFDEALGRLVERDGVRARTAYLHVNFRSLTPVDVDLRIAIGIDRTVERKIYGSGRLYEGERLLADAEGLWVVPRTP